MSGALEDIIEAFPEFLTDEPVNGGDLVEFVGGMIQRYEAGRPRAVHARCFDCGTEASKDAIGQVCGACRRGVIEESRL